MVWDDSPRGKVNVYRDRNCEIRVNKDKEEKV